MSSSHSDQELASVRQVQQSKFYFYLISLKMKHPFAQNGAFSLYLQVTRTLSSLLNEPAELSEQGGIFLKNS